MRAVVLTGERSVDVEVVDDARLPGPDGVVVAVEGTAICGSDLHLYHGDIPALGVHLGHEFIGTVTEAGAGVRTLGVGDRVLVSGIVGCGRCRPCRAGDPALCANGSMSVFGTTPELPGGQAEAVGVPWADTFARPIPEGVDDDQALLLTDILPTGYLAAERAAIEPGATVAVIGLGPVGVLALQCAALFGPARVFALDTVADRLARAAALGAEPIDAGGGTGVAELLERTRGRGADAVIEAIGRDETIVDAVGCAAPGATVSIVGVTMNIALPLPGGRRPLQEAHHPTHGGGHPGHLGHPHRPLGLGAAAARGHLHPPARPLPGGGGLPDLRPPRRRRPQGDARPTFVIDAGRRVSRPTARRPRALRVPRARTG